MPGHPDSAALPDVEAIRDCLRRVVDPEVGVNIVDLGLVYRIEAGVDGVTVDMTMTSPACPMGEMVVDEAKAALAKALPPATAVDVRLVWSPPWDPSLMSDAAKRQLGW